MAMGIGLVPGLGAAAASARPDIWAQLRNGLGRNSNALVGLGFGLLGGNPAAAGQGWEQGAAVDDAYATSKKDEAQRLQSLNQTAAWARKQFPSLAGAPDEVAAQLAPQLYSEALKGGGDLTTTVQGRQQLGQQYGLKDTDLTNYVLTGKLTSASGSAPTFGQTPVFLTDNTDPNNPVQHMGQMSSGGGLFVDGKTLPGLPKNWTVGSNNAGTLSPEALDMIATQYLAGDKSAITGFARNASMRGQIAEAVAAKANAMGMDGRAIAAGISAYGGNVAAQRAAGTRAAQVGMAASEANQMADIALEASKAVPRGAFTPWNAAVNAVSTNTSSPEMAAFVTATTSLVNAYARAVSPLGAPTDAMRQHAEQMLNTAQGPDAYAAVISQMKKEMEAALNAPAEISDQLRSSVTGDPSGPAPQAASGGTYATNPQTGQRVMWNGSAWVPAQ